ESRAWRRSHAAVERASQAAWPCVRSKAATCRVISASRRLRSANSSPSRCPSTLDGSSHGSSPWSRSSPSASRPSGHTPEESGARGLPVSSSSQPAIMAVMLQLLRPLPGQRVLEIGAGTGYNAALIAHLVGPAGHVVTVDIDADLVERARGHLAAAGAGGVEA